jgi:hypothetical protein
VKSRLKEILAGIGESWFSIFLALAPAPAIFLGAVLIHFKTDIAYRWLQSESAAHVLRYVRSGLFLATVIGITITVLVLRKTKPALRKKVFVLYFLVPVAGFLIYVSWAPTMLICLFALAVLTLTQLPLLRDVISAYQRKRGGFKLLLTLQGTVLFLLLVFGIVLWVQVRDRAYRNAQWIEIKSKGLYGEFSDLRALAQNPHVEYALITDPALRFHKVESHRFGSGEDAYTVTYAMLSNDDAESLDPAQWPLWYYCGSGGCYDKTPLLVSVDLCPNPKDCGDDFAWVIRRVRFRIQNSDTTPPYPPTLRLLSPAGDLTLTDHEWRSNIQFTLRIFLYFQISYFIFHALLATVNRLLKKPAGRS